MAKADLHVHSKYSDYPSTWILKAYDSPESFTDPETLYQQAKARGMDLVTITDHDDIRGCLELQKNHPHDTFISCEITTFFPEDYCKIHILVYGISEKQYEEIMRIRDDIYNLRDYIARQNIAYSVAHATYDQDGKLSFEHIEKLILLFDVFEIINGGVSKRSNQLLQKYLLGLDDQLLDELQAKHHIRPISKEPWVKGFTGGSDDHCGILIGTAYTQSHAQDVEGFLNSIKLKTTIADGLHGSFESYATGVIKHIHDYRKNRDDKYQRSKMNDFLKMFFTGHQGNWLTRFRKSHSLSYLKRKNSRIHKALHNLLLQISLDNHHDIAQRIPLAYQQVANLHDEMFRSTVVALTRKLPQGEIFNAFQKLTNIFPMILLASPFIGSMRHQVLKSDIKQKLIEGCTGEYTAKALWFTDTIDDLNGVSVTLRQIAKHSQEQAYNLKLVTCIDEDNSILPLPVNTLNLKPIYRAVVLGYEQQTVFFPSLLTMMKKIADEQPDQIIVSTPGPVGLGALLCAKLLDLPSKSIYHTDFAEQVLRMTDENSLANITGGLVNAFYKQFDQVYVPSQSYINKLATNGLERDKLTIFPRGLDLNIYKSKQQEDKHLLQRYQLHGKFTLLYAGRISEDKNLNLLSEIAKQMNNKQPDLFNMIIAGDGPQLESLKQDLKSVAGVHFTGRLDVKELVEWYQTSDLLVFPSHTDTFGMVVLEAQACGIPCLVTNSGGPKEIISPGITGKIIANDNPRDWLAAIKYYYRLKNLRPREYQALSERCIRKVIEQNSWKNIFSDVLGAECQFSGELPNSNIIPIQPKTTAQLDQIA